MNSLERGYIIFSLTFIIFATGYYLATKIQQDEIRKRVSTMAEVEALKEKYPREAGVISKLAFGVVVLRERDAHWGKVVARMINQATDGGIVIKQNGVDGSAHCLKSLYGKDGEKLLRELHVRIEEDEYQSAADCFKNFGIVPVSGI